VHQQRRQCHGGDGERDQCGNPVKARATHRADLSSLLTAGQVHTLRISGIWSQRTNVGFVRAPIAGEGAARRVRVEGR
jgi:hypothetical protein